MNTKQEVEALRFDANSTLRWPCRRGDFILWFSFKGLFSHPGDSYSFADFWEIRDGDSVLITNRIEDIPVWFELHPMEVCGSFVWPMKAKLDAGYEPGEILEGPNLWRIKAGDCLAWIGKSRTGYQNKNDLLQLVCFSECALIIGESAAHDFDALVSFGSLSDEGENKEIVGRFRETVKVVQNLGTPRTFSPEWKLG